MTKKRRNNGHRVRSNARGHVSRVRCCNCACMVAKDKAIKKTIVKNIVGPSIIKDIKDASVYNSYEIPKYYINLNYCVSCAVHNKLIN